VTDQSAAAPKDVPAAGAPAPKDVPAAGAAAPRITVRAVVVTWNGAELLPRCLRRDQARAAENHHGMVDARSLQAQVGFEQFHLKADAARFGPQQKFRVGKGHAARIGRERRARIQMRLYGALQVSPGV
jgi:hypothetical protein